MKNFSKISLFCTIDVCRGFFVVKHKLEKFTPSLPFNSKANWGQKIGRRRDYVSNISKRIGIQILPKIITLFDIKYIKIIIEYFQKWFQ